MMSGCVWRLRREVHGSFAVMSPEVTIALQASWLFTVNRSGNKTKERLIGLA
jgi:hypothetical protein